MCQEGRLVHGRQRRGLPRFAVVQGVWQVHGQGPLVPGVTHPARPVIREATETNRSLPMDHSSGDAIATAVHRFMDASGCLRGCAEQAIADA